jgi:hypothetical protein
MGVLFPICGLLTALIAPQPFADTPPVPPLDPAQLAEAQKLTKLLPIEAAISVEMQEILAEPAEAADQWLSGSYPGDYNSRVRLVFAEKVKRLSNTLMDKAFDEARTAMADDYARQLDLVDLVATQRFASSDEGRAFLFMQLRRDNRLRQLIVRSIYSHLNFNNVLQDARDTTRLIDQVNRRR